MGQIEQSVGGVGVVTDDGDDRVTKLMAHHPTYLDLFLRTHEFVMRGDGPLPFHHRHYIGIMAAGRHQSGYLMGVCREGYITEGGDPLWLSGLCHAPAKLTGLYEINKLLAHRPWLLTSQHIQGLTEAGDGDNWSLAEVVHGLVLLAHFHSLSSFVWASGLDSNQPPPPAAPSLPPDPPPPKDEGEVGVATLVERLQRVRREGGAVAAAAERAMFDKVEVELPSETLPPDPALQHLIQDPQFVYEDFAHRSLHVPTLRVHDYSWGDQGFSLVNRLYNEVGDLLDAKFTTLYELTYYTVAGRKQIDTSRFRRAIWNYIHCIFGIRHDDYDYSEVNQLLERSLKSFVKMACCFPERLTKADHDTVLRQFKNSEKVHINLMILEARMQAELLYALRAVMRYMT